MKKIRKFGFSLIELMVVVSIMTLVFSWTVFYFTKFIDETELKKNIANIKDSFDSLDEKINNREIFDYEIVLVKDKNFFYSNQNIFDLDLVLDFEDLNNEGIWKFSFSWTNSGTWSIKYYKSYKFQKEEDVGHNNYFTGSLEDYWEYKIMWSFSWTELNTIIFNYFNEKKDTILKNIEYWGNSNSSELKIKSILWKKIFWDDESINEIILTFEDYSWRTEVLKLTK